MKIFHGIMYAVLTAIAIIGFNFHPIHIVHSVKEIPVIITKIVHPSSNIDNDELNCLTKNIFFEARNQPYAGKMMVGLVTIERTKNPNYPDTVCKVVYQGKQWKGQYIKNKCQFSWVCDGKSNHVDLTNVIEKQAWEQCQSIAQMLLKHSDDIDNDKLVNYHASYVHPSWARSKQFHKTMKVGDHIFYQMVASR